MHVNGTERDRDKLKIRVMILPHIYSFFPSFFFFFFSPFNWIYVIWIWFSIAIQKKWRFHPSKQNVSRHKTILNGKCIEFKHVYIHQKFHHIHRDRQREKTVKWIKVYRYIYRWRYLMRINRTRYLYPIFLKIFEFIQNKFHFDIFRPHFTSYEWASALLIYPM